MKMKKIKKFISMAMAATMVVTSFVVPPSASTEVKAADKGYEERLTPIMGWSSWNEFKNHISEEMATSNMDLMVEYGLVDVGYTYFNLDDGFQAGRKNGKLQYNAEKFPNGMKYIADYAHERGMKAGIYSDIGKDTCASGAQDEGNHKYQNLPGSKNGLGVGFEGHIDDDLKTYFNEWGYDFIKVDWCGGRNLGWMRPPEYDKNKTNGMDKYYELGEKIEAKRKELKKDIIYNVCCWRFPGEKIAVDSQADSWRSGGDLWANWGNILDTIDGIKDKAKYSKPGKCNDLDMMQVGRGLTYEEDKSHFSMWAMAGSPLMIGCDLRKATPETIEILKNKEIIAIDQDPACIAATVAKTYTFSDGNTSKGQNKVEVWTRDLGKKDSGTKAVAVFNRTDKERTVQVSWEELGLSGNVMVRDLWQHRYITAYPTQTVTVPAHGTMVYKVTGDVSEDSSDVAIENANLTKIEMQVNNQSKNMNLTELGTADWIYYGDSDGTKFRRKANVPELLKYTGQTTGSDDYYKDAATNYSWSDGTPQQSSSGVKQGLAVAKSVGGYGQVDAPSDSREHLLHVQIVSWKADVRVDFMVNGKVVKSQEVKATAGSDGALRVNKVAKIRYSTNVPATVSLRWTITNQHANNGNIAVEAATLEIEDKDKDPAELCGVVNNVLDNEVDLVAEGTVDYMQFGGNNGDVSAEKGNTNTLQKYTTGSGAKVSSADTTVTYKVGDKSTKKGAMQSALNSTFKIKLPKTDEMTQAKIYFGVQAASVKLSSVYGNLVFDESVIESDGARVNKVASIYYKSDKDLTVDMKMVGTLGGTPQMTLDAVTLKKVNDTIVLTPEVSQSDNTAYVSTRVIRQGNSTKAKKLEMKAYDQNGSAKKTETVNIADASDVTVKGQITLDAGFKGKLEVKVLSDGNKVIGETYTYELPLGNKEDSGTIGRFTAMKLQKEGAIMVDVRNPEELSEGHIEGSINVPYLDSDFINKADAALKKAGATKDTNIILYCATGKRSAQSRNLLKDILGYKNVYDIGGYENYVTEPKISFTNFQEVITKDTNIYITLGDVEYDEVTLKYSIGENSTINDAKDYTGPFKLSESSRVKAYVMFDGEVVYQTSNEFLVHSDKVPDVSRLEGKYCSELTPKKAYVARFTVGNNEAYYNSSDNEKASDIDKDGKKETLDIIMAGKNFDKGIYTHTPSEVTYEIPEGMNRFVAVAGWLDKAQAGNWTTLHRILIDGQQVGKQIRLSRGRLYTFDITIPEGAKELTLETQQGNSDTHKYYAMFTCWGIARFVKDPNADPNKGIGENIAKGKKVVSTHDENEQNSAKNLVDGNTGSRWSSAGGSAPHAFEIDLGSIYELSSLNTYWYKNNREYTYNVYLSDTSLLSGKLKNEVTPTIAQIKGVGSDNGSKKTTYNFTGKARGRYLTIETTKNSNNTQAASLFEVEAYGIKVGETFVPTVIPGLETNPVDEVVNAIEAIGDVTLDKESKITAARAAYNSLTDDQKKQVSADVLKKLTDAEAKLEELKKNEENPGEKPPVEQLPPTDSANTYEAENAALTAACVVSESATSSNGKFVGELGGSKGGKATFTVNAAQAGKYDVNIYYITHYDRNFEVAVNGGAATTVNCVGNNTDWDATVAIATASVELKAGVNTITLGNAGDYAPNLDKIVLELKEAINDNKPVDEEAQKLEAAKAALKAAVEAAASYEKANYTEDSWTGFETALTAAKVALDNAESKTEDLTAAKDALTAAQNALVKVEQDVEGLATAKEALNTAVANAKPAYEKGKSVYTDETWTPFAKAYADATNPTAIATATVEELNNFAAALTKAQGALVEKPIDEQNAELEAAKTALAEAVAAAKETYETGADKYTEDTWNAFKDAYDAAAKPADDANVVTLTGLKDALVKAQEALKENTPGTVGDPTEDKEALKAAEAELNAAVEAANESYDKGKDFYTAETWETFEKAYNAATEVEDDATVDEIKALKDALVKAQADLKEKEHKDDNAQPDDNQNQTTNDNKQPQTGTQNPPATDQNPAPVVQQPTPEEAAIAATLGVSADVAKQVNEVVKQYNVSMDTLVLTEAKVTGIASEADVAGSTFRQLQAKAQKQTKSSVKLKWNEVDGADGYVVYGNKCGKNNAYEVLATLESGNTSYTQKGLKKGTSYKYLVCAYKNVAGVKVTLAASKTIHTVTKGGKTGVAKAVSVYPSKVNLRVGKSSKITAREVKADLRIKAHRKLSFESDNETIATVTKSGKVKGKSKGSCYVYVYAQNGVSKRVRVTVK